MTPSQSILVGLVAGALIPMAVVMFDRIKLDDPVGATSVHLVCGIWGTLAVGLIGAQAGLGQLLTQITGIAAIGFFTFSFSFGTFYIIKMVSGIRVSEEQELRGLDITEHEMEAYSGTVNVAYDMAEE